MVRLLDAGGWLTLRAGGWLRLRRAHLNSGGRFACLVRKVPGWLESADFDFTTISKGFKASKGFLGGPRMSQEVLGCPRKS